MRSLHLSTLAVLLPLNLVHAITSHSPLDLLAHPAYAVRLNPGNPISNSSAERILAGRVANDKQEASHGHGSELQIQQPRSGTLSGDDAETTAFKSFLLRSGSNGQAYLCNVPQYTPADKRRDEAAGTAAQNQPLTSEEKAERRRNSEQEKRQAFERGLALLEPLKGHCLYLTQGWFTYAFCHGSEIRQFHAIRVQNPNGLGIAEDPTQDSYTLGQWSNRVVEDEGLMDSKKARALGSLREILEGEDKEQQNAVGFVHGNGRGDVEGTGDEKRYLVQRWSGGTLCDKTGLDRRVEVQFHCNSQSSDRIFLIRETAICEYVMVIHTPRLCGEPIFVGNGGADDAATEKRKKEVSIVDCRPIVGDAVLGLSQGEEAKTYGGSGAAADSSESRSPAVEVKQHEEQQEASQPETRPYLSNNAAPQQEPQQAESAQSDSQGQANAQDIMESFVLVLDPATGEMVIEADVDIPNPGGAEGEEGQNLFDGKTLDDIMKTLKKSIEQTLSELNSENAGAKQGDTAETKQSAQEGQTKQEEASLAANQKKLEQLSRLTRSGAHNHKKTAEQFVKGQLKHQPRKTALGQTAQQQQAGQGGEQQQLGTPQHRNLKKAFEMKWDEDEETKQRRQASTARQRDEL